MQLLNWIPAKQSPESLLNLGEMYGIHPLLGLMILITAITRVLPQTDILQFSLSMHLIFLTR